MKKEEVKRVWSEGKYIVVAMILFYLAPKILMGIHVFPALLVLVFLPISIFLLSLIYGRNHGFHFYYCLIIGILFLGSRSLYYNESASIYALVYGVVAFAGNLAGTLLKWRREIEDNTNREEE